jgi:uncharacterized membrane protein AbrB (regulator of aidB expression)
VAVPVQPFIIAQGFIGCLVARSIGPGILPTMLRQWPVFVVCVGGVIVFSTVLGGLLARWKVLPGTTAIWGSTPGAATVMVLLAEAARRRPSTGSPRSQRARSRKQWRWVWSGPSPAPD